MNIMGRRNFLRGMGSSFLALPWLESLATGGAALLPPQRAAFYYVPIGVVRQTFFPGEEKSIVQQKFTNDNYDCLLYTSPSPRDVEESRMPSSA